MSDTASAEVPAYLAIAISVGTLVLGIINHKRVRSSCCRKTMEVSLDIDNTTPPQLRPAPPILTSVPPADS
jgi:hypothetical protein